MGSNIAILLSFFQTIQLTLREITKQSMYDLFDNWRTNRKNYFTVLWSFDLLYFRILDSVVMSAVIDPPPNVLTENITLVFKNAQVYTPLFRYLLFIYFLFNLIGVACLLVCFMKGKHQQFMCPTYRWLCCHLLP